MKRVSVDISSLKPAEDGSFELQDKKPNVSQQDRYNFTFGFIGANRTGKSSIARETALTWKESRPDGIIWSHDPQNRFKDISDGFFYPTDKNEWVQECMELRNALIILDDYRILHESPKAAKGLGTLLSHRADYNIDIIYICHNPSLVINMLTYYTTHYYLFYTEALEGSFSSKIPNYKLAYNATAMINSYVSKYGRGEHPKFPHIVADVERRKLIGQNVDKQKLMLAMAQDKKGK